MNIEQLWAQLIQEYGQVIMEQYQLMNSGNNPDLSIYHNAIGVLQGYSRACYETGVVTGNDYNVMVQQIECLKRGNF